MKENELQDTVSEITEMPVTFGVSHFLAALGWGTLAGTGAIIVVLLAGSGFEPIGQHFDLALGILWAISLIVAAFTLVGFVIVGLPLTFGLRQIQQERAAVYTSIGALAGFLIIAVMFEAHRQEEAFWFAMIGALTGGACAYRWGRWREALAAQHKNEPPAKRSNPVHDLIF